MKVLLVNPWIYDFAAFDLWSKPLGLLNIASWLRASGAEVRLIDCLDRFHPALVRSFKGKLPKTTCYGNGQYYAEEIEKPAVFAHIPRRFKRYGLPLELFEQILTAEPEPDVILVTSGMTYWYLGVFEAIKRLKNRFPRKPVILGGNYARLCYHHALNNSGADVVYSGTDMREISRLIENLSGKKTWDRLDENVNLAPAYDLYDTLSYITLRTSGGCPFKCSYCGWYLLEEGIKREPTDIVLNEIERYWQKGVNNFAFYDDALLYQAEDHCQKILTGIIQKKIKAFFHTPNGLHTRFLTSVLARLMKQAGFIQPRLALETTSESRQNETSPKTDNKAFLQAVQSLREAGYRGKEIGVNILIGQPGQDPAEIQESVAFVRTTGCRIFLEEYSPVPGTKDYEQTGLKIDCDPLLHNNTAFLASRQAQDDKIEAIKNQVHQYNLTA